MTETYHGLPITLQHDVVALGSAGGCGHCLLMLMDTWIAGSGWRAHNAHDHPCNHVPGTENPPSLKQSKMIGSLRRVFWLGRSKALQLCCCRETLAMQQCIWLFMNERFLSSESKAEQWALANKTYRGQPVVGAVLVSYCTIFLLQACFQSLTETSMLLLTAPTSRISQATYPWTSRRFCIPATCNTTDQDSLSCMSQNSRDHAGFGDCLSSTSISLHTCTHTGRATCIAAARWL
jgi:hypothetical protein